MADSTPIEWADATWSPWEGCTKVGPGCDHCYAESMNRWLRKGENWGSGAPRREYSDEHWRKPTEWNAKCVEQNKRISVFPSVCDPFDNEIEQERRDRFFDLIERTQRLTWLLLTKRIGNVCHHVWPRWMQQGFPANVWIGATVVNQEELERDAPKLCELPARVRFISYEPALGPIDVGPYLSRDKLFSLLPGFRDPMGGINWVIAGGESGRQARPAHPDWFGRVRDHCVAAGVPFLFKQWGEHAPNARTFAQISDSGRPGVPVAFFPDRPDIISPKYPTAIMDRVGKKAAGRELFGHTWDEFPCS